MRNILFVLLLSATIARGAENDCLQSFVAPGTTYVSVMTDGQLVPLTETSTTTLYAPCGTDWTTIRETITVIAADCSQTQTRDEPRLTSMNGEPPKITCLVLTDVRRLLFVSV